MRAGGRISAAIEVLTEIDARHVPATVALQNWGRAHRFAGSGDRAAIGNLVFDALRHKASACWVMNNESPRAAVLGALALHIDTDRTTVNEWFSGEKFCPDPLSDAETKALDNAKLQIAPDWVRAELPEWVATHFAENFDEELVSEGQALAARPPIDLRVNTLKANREKVIKALSRFKPNPTPLSPEGLRIAPPDLFGRSANVQADGAYQKGWVEVQDEASQITARLVFPQPGEQVLDYCAGAGGKTLAMAALMENKGQIFAYDADRNRLAPIHQRLKRAGVRNVQVREPGDDALSGMEGRMDRVVIDAPCTGSGIWRRRPDAKWRLTPETLETRKAEQHAVLQQAAQYVREGGYLCYITCSLIPEENEHQIYSFLEEADGAFDLLSAGEVWEDTFPIDGAKPWSADECSVTLTPAATNTDGFYFAVAERVK
ncbi:MAG: RsmB/NOP family class I SAM-dependent RNA methyltransferase [Hyphomicrobiales bacterium]